MARDYSGLPAPLVAADVNLQALDWFKLHHKRLADSEWWQGASYMARAVSIDLWVAAYQKVPAASLEDNDIVLAKCAGFGRDIDNWLAVKSEIMASWELCSDGRWYHPTLAEVANEAWEATELTRRAWREKKASQRAKAKEGVSTRDRKPRSDKGKKRGPQKRPPGQVPMSTGDMPLRKEKNITKGKRPSNEGTKARKRTPAAKGKTPKKGTRLPIGWGATDEQRAYAAGKGYLDHQINDLEDNFVAYWRNVADEKKALKLDWNLAWGTWVRNQAKWDNERNGRRGSGTATPTRNAAAQREADRTDNLFAAAVAVAKRNR